MKTSGTNLSPDASFVTSNVLLSELSKFLTFWNSDLEYVATTFFCKTHYLIPPNFAIVISTILDCSASDKNKNLRKILLAVMKIM